MDALNRDSRAEALTYFSRPALEPEPHSLASTLRIPNSVADYLRANPSYLSPSQLSGHGDLARAYFIERVCRKDWLPLRSYLPETVESMLDVGGGVGGFGLFAYRFAGQPAITLVEQTGRHLQGRNFDVLGLAREFFAANAVPRRALSLLAVGERSLRLIENESYDLIVSLRAVAFVFPYQCYRAALLQSLRPGGLMILDIKKKNSDFQRSFDTTVRERFAESDPNHRDTITQLEQDFGFVNIIADYENSVRVLVRREEPHNPWLRRAAH